MQALTLMIVYVLTTFAVQFVGFLISRLVDYEYPTLGLMTFLILFLGAFGLAWPIAVRIAEALIRWRGYEVQSKQSGGDARRDECARKQLQRPSTPAASHWRVYIGAALTPRCSAAAMREKFTGGWLGFSWR